MINILGILFLVCVLFWPTWISLVRNGFYTTGCIFCLNIMLVLVMIVIPEPNTLMDMLSSVLWILSYYVLVISVPYEKEPKSLTNLIGKV